MAPPQSLHTHYQQLAKLEEGAGVDYSFFRPSADAPPRPRRSRVSLILLSGLRANFYVVWDCPLSRHSFVNILMHIGKISR